MKVLILIQMLTFSFSMSAAEIKLDHYNWVLDDVAEEGVTKEEIFRRLPRKMFASGAAICANKAHVWAYHIKKEHNVDSGKVFLFFTDKFKRWGGWWYHVAPFINEGGVEWVVDGGFKKIKKPMLLKDWMKHWQKNFSCYEITPKDKDLIEYMHTGGAFPSDTFRGTYPCYFIKTPAGYWWPSSIAKNLLGVDESGEPVNYSQDEINHDEVYAACKEAVTGPLRSLLGWGDRKCSGLMSKYDEE